MKADLELLDVLKGVHLFQGLPDETIASLQPGDHLGEMCMLDGGPRSATVVATGDLSTMGMSSWTMCSMLKEYPDLAVHVIEVLATRLRAANERSLD